MQTLTTHALACAPPTWMALNEAAAAMLVGLLPSTPTDVAPHAGCTSRASALLLPPATATGAERRAAPLAMRSSIESLRLKGPSGGGAGGW